MEYLDLAHAHRASGTLRLPGSKSISNRTLLLAALAEGTTRVRGLLDSDDTQVMLESLRRLGVPPAPGERDGEWSVTGAPAGFPVKEASLFLGNAGTAFRSLTAVLALGDGRYRLEGVPRMHERPIGDLVDALRQAGASIDYIAKEGFPPLAIGPRQRRADAVVRVRGDVSSQFLTALLIATGATGGGVRIEVEGELISKPYVEMTLALMARFGVAVAREGWGAFVVPAGARYRSPGAIDVEGDASSASYFLAAGLLGGGPLRVEGVGRASLQGDVRFTEVIEAMGGKVVFGENWIEVSGHPPLKALDADLNRIPDAAMTAAVLALFASGPSRLRNIASWRVKETDRLTAMATELRKLGAGVEEGADYLRITPPAGFADAAPAPGRVAIDTYDDHRMAMCFALASFGPVPIRINDPRCVSKTFPEFFEAWSRVVSDDEVPVIAIDGPSASGKGTVAERVAASLGFRYLDSGALYRLATLQALRRQVSLDDPDAQASAAREMEISFSDGKLWLDGEDVTEAARTEAVSAATSRVAASPAVRQALLERQHRFRQAPGLVADGRDMGSVVFPDAALKVFLTADVATRAERRHKQLMEKGMCAKMPDVVEELRQRDTRDSSRPVAPLKHYPDALFLDTSHLTIDQAVEQVLAWYRERARG
jgi:3-phosphoshikimate 1-carboxyvinyltransferase